MDVLVLVIEGDELAFVVDGTVVDGPALVLDSAREDAEEDDDGRAQAGAEELLLELQHEL